ncbi:acyltransferase 3 family protein (plasmid) [Rhizobium etli 8C-3]|uniref:Exopolysaccharide production protein ExoZ n=2 Tax=Rhizobium TaxID=379 RepID=A0A4R3R7I2_9HYPH|nr:MULTISPECIES: acyltransferase [Rhizobium]APO78220.1 acyltransferase 3 family protein [Rhizobium etli 8C-3]TCU31180.1 exopolysaccharide production protein ExoZ [Rhizobium azibense]TCU40809.1 exopolysaccharide production protein ExoZ [Rhizobium azibense]
MSNARLGRRGNTIYPVQYLRAFAATAVAVYHIGFIFGWQWRPLAAGVDLFFVVSGFIMWSVTAGKLMRPVEFLAHRFIKIVPLYWLFTIIFVVGARLSPGSFDQASPTVSEVAKSLLFIPYSARDGVDGPALAVGWTLNMEMYFYLIFAYGLVLKEGRRLIYLTITLGTLMLARLLSSEVASLKVVASPLLLEFFAGIFIGVWHHSGRALPKNAHMLLIALGLAGVALSFWLGAPASGSKRVLLWGLPAALLLVGALSCERNGRQRKIEFLRYIGDASYALYLSHVITIAYCRYILDKAGFEARDASLSQQLSVFAIVFIVCMAVGIACYYALDNPSHQWMKQRLRRYWERPITSARTLRP